MWYSKSNNYSVVETEFKTLLDHYLSSESLESFTSKVTAIDDLSNPTEIAKNLQLYLERCNVEKTQSNQLSLKFNDSKRHIEKYYRFKDKIFQINFDSDLVKKTVHPAIAYLEIPESKPQTKFDIYLDGETLCLFENEQLIIAIPKREYHRLQGKFVMRLLTIIHDKDESDWLATFHGSTISDGDNAILFVGQSGKGKSTLSALLTAHGFELVADDVSPLVSNSKHIYHNPLALSIKQGAFDILRPLISHFDTIPTTIFNKTKGQLKYVPCSMPTKESYPCKSIVIVDYCEGSETLLKAISIKALLEILIPESWLSPNSSHAIQLLTWLKNVDFYQLTYSNTKSVTENINALFEQLKKD